MFPGLGALGYLSSPPWGSNKRSLPKGDQWPTSTATSCGSAERTSVHRPEKWEQSGRESFNIHLSFLTRARLIIFGDKLRQILREQNCLRDQGRIVWGVLVQANNALFDPNNRQTLPANLIFSPDNHFDDSLPTLQQLARRIADLREASPANAQVKQLALAVSNKTLRTMRLQVPPVLCHDRQVFFTTCLIHPPHLPAHFLGASFFPLVICPEKTEAVMILPSTYWPEQLRESWLNTDSRS